MNLRLPAFALALLSSALYAGSALASTGVCDSNPPTSTQACIDAIQANGGVVNDIFKDANGLTADKLPLFGTFFNQWPNCPQSVPSACAGTSNAPYDCPGEYGCAALPATFATASTYMNALDRLWYQPCRLADATLVNGCPQYTCIADGTGGNYVPWEGLVFDLGGPSNKVAIFAENDHGPQPCESTEYTVYLSDNPFAQDLIQDPKTTGVDPAKWNRAVLSKIYTEGFVKIRPTDPAGHAACGDTASYSVEEDSFVSVYALPCGITFRYASIVAGNDGFDFPACAYDSMEAEVDAIAGLTENGSAVCPDVDGDHYVDCQCPGAPPICDCNDADKTIHPGAPEACDAPDLNCDGKPGACQAGLVCYKSVCIATCGVGENIFCPAGSSCKSTAQGNLCVPADCTNVGCPPGGTCKNGACVPACDGVKCPGQQLCQDGACIDPCANIQCPMGTTCQGGQCVSPCNCYAGDAGCAGQAGAVCDVNNTNECVQPTCKGVMCPPGQTCDPTTGKCAGFCDPSVKCPDGQKCVDPGGCVPLCNGVSCGAGFICDPKTGTCADTSCQGVSCLPPLVCSMGACVTPDGGGAGGGSTSSSTSSGGQGGGSTSSSSSSGAGGAPQDPGDTGGCGCRDGSREASSSLGALAAMLGLALAARRKRRG